MSIAAIPADYLSCDDDCMVAYMAPRANEAREAALARFLHRAAVEWGMPIRSGAEISARPRRYATDPEDGLLRPVAYIEMIARRTATDPRCDLWVIELENAELAPTSREQKP